jgi:hypothetical protein
MPDWATCMQAAQSAKVVNNDKGASVSVFCAYKKQS